MRNLKYLFTAAAIGSLLALSQTSSASPLAAGLAASGSQTTTIADDLVQKVHGWHCGRKWSKRLGRHRHRRACYDYDDDYYSYGYGYPGYGYGYPGYGLGFAPFFSFGFFDFDDDHHFRGHHRRHHFRGHHRRHHGKWWKRRHRHW
jgi:hypothetical protein